VATDDLTVSVNAAVRWNARFWSRRTRNRRPGTGNGSCRKHLVWRMIEMNIKSTTRQQGL